MKQIFAIMCAGFIMVSTITVQAQHVPPCGGTHHSVSICRGYATARAYGNGWADADCPGSTLNFSAISGPYFDVTTANLAEILANVKKEDIIMWGPGGDPHAAYVASAPGPGAGNSVTNVILDQVRREGETPQTGLTLLSVINDFNVNPDHYARLVTYQVTFKNNFLGGNAGKIEVDGNEVNSPATFTRARDILITGERVNQTINGITYTFEDWSNGSSTSTLTYEPKSDATFTANFDGTPVKITGFQFIQDIGESVEFTWDEHPSANVTYRIYRRVKTQTEWLPITLEATLSHGTTSYLDQEYTAIASGTIFVLFYDVRAYYTPDATEASVKWYSLYGGYPLPKTAGAFGVPKEFGLSNFPNPFNPTTTINIDLPEVSTVTLEIYDIKGRNVRRWDLGHQQRGYAQIQWDGRDESGKIVSAGIYLYKLQAHSLESGKNFLTVRKMLFVK